MAVYEIKPEFYNYVFSPYLEPAIRIKRGDTVVFHTEDAFESRIKTHDDLPAKARDYVLRLEELAGAYVSCIGVGPGRDQTIVRRDILAAK